MIIMDRIFRVYEKNKLNAVKKRIIIIIIIKKKRKRTKGDIGLFYDILIFLNKIIYKT